MKSLKSDETTNGEPPEKAFPEITGIEILRSSFCMYTRCLSYPLSYFIISISGQGTSIESLTRRGKIARTLERQFPGGDGRGAGRGREGIAP